MTVQLTRYVAQMAVDTIVWIQMQVCKLYCAKYGNKIPWYSSFLVSINPYNEILLGLTSSACRKALFLFDPQCPYIDAGH